MGKVTYNADIAHCTGRACLIRDKCVRYYNHQRTHVLSNEVVPYIEEQYKSETNECEMFKPLK